MKLLNKSELEFYNGGGLMGAFAGGVIGFVGGVVIAAVKSVVDSDADDATFAKQIYASTLVVAGIGAVASGPF